MNQSRPVLSFVIPCLNESATLASVIGECHQGGRAAACSYEIIVADNGSTDGSQQIALNNGARVVNVPTKGYGAALAGGISKAKGKYILMGDADSTYDFRQAPIFIEKLKQGYDLVMGNRFQGEILTDAMPFLHRHLGNPVLSALGRLFFGIHIGDFHCGLRAFDRAAINSLNLHCSGMEFASEMVIKASLLDLQTAEIPTVLRSNPPGRKPHLKTWRDGWRHLKFMLSFSPKYSLLPIAAVLLLAALVLTILFALRTAPFTGANTMIFAASCSIAAMSIFSDYLLTREMLYWRLSVRKKRISSGLDYLLGLHKGTDRLFKLSAAFLFLSLSGLIVMLIFWSQSLLALPMAAVMGLLSCASMFFAISFYLTATKLSTYRSLHNHPISRRMDL
ncbi:MAG: glycosyltransferase family 2 protein [Cyanobacteriota bacterium]|nr:glycosyltransferase family 2 protein [Cyanobacteriota bacterium]